MVTVCPRCHKKAWKPYRFVIKGKSGKSYTYLDIDTTRRIAILSASAT